MTNEEYQIMMHGIVGDFAEDKDKAADIRLKQIFPALKEGKSIILDFQNVNSATQSFIHALISDVIRKEGIEVLDKIQFRNCNGVVKAIIEIVVDYMQEPSPIIRKYANGKKNNQGISPDKKE